uniref:WD_REPEATS_REGION domain-containing protein n=1 Tax=Syphacia muris TaxID=451379 RepID=A0A0N5ABB1_9BILA
MANAQTSSGLIVPVVLWGKKPPKNRISCVQPLPDGKTIITGSLDGEIVIWNKSADGKIVASMMLVGQESKITCISPTGVTGKSTRFVTASSDRLLSLWDSVDGRNIDNVISNYVHLQITPHRSRFGSHGWGRSALYCIGEYSEIVVIDPQDLNVIFTLNSRVEPDWISAIAFIRPTAISDSVVGVSVSGMMKIWKLADMDKKVFFFICLLMFVICDFPTVVYEEESKTVSASLANAVSWDVSNQSCILVVAMNSWQIFDLTDMNLLITMKSQEPLCGGSVIGESRLAICTSSGYIQLFYVPKSVFNSSYSSDRSPAAEKTQPYIFAMLLGNSSDFAWPSRMVYCFNKRENAASKLGDNASNTNTWTAYRASIDGELCVWNIPEVPDEQVQKCASKPVIFKPTITTSLMDIWKSLKETPRNIFETQEDCSITATLYIGAQGRLVLGLKDGTILLMYACEAITKQLLQTDSSDVSCRRLYGHKAAVTCMLYPHEEHSRYDSHLLISGSADFAVIVWNINTGSRLHRFCVQGGTILRLFVPPPTCNARILHTICSVAGDNSAALLSLKENKCLLLASRQSFPIVDVRWRPADDFLLLKCEDDTLYVWQIDTTSLERVVKGIVSEEILLGCEEQIRGEDFNDETGASQAVQMIRAVRYRNIDAVCFHNLLRLASFSFFFLYFLQNIEINLLFYLQIRKIAMGERDKIVDSTDCEVELPSPMSVTPLNRTADAPHVVFFNVDSLIIGLQLANKAEGSGEFKSLSTILQGKQAGNNSNNNRLSQKTVYSAETNLYMDVASLCLSLLHAWTMDENLDDVCVRKLKMHKPSVSLSFGLVSRQGSLSLMLPRAIPKSCHENSKEIEEANYDRFAAHAHWCISSSMTTIHLLTVIAIANTLISLKGLLFDTAKRKSLTRQSSIRSSSSDISETESKVKQGYSLLAALHCYLLPGHIKAKGAYSAPRIELLAR